MLLLLPLVGVVAGVNGCAADQRDRAAGTLQQIGSDVTSVGSVVVPANPIIGGAIIGLGTLITTAAGVIATKQQYAKYSPPWDGTTERRTQQQRRAQTYSGPDRRGGGTTTTPGAPPPLPMGVPQIAPEPKEFSRAA